MQRTIKRAWINFSHKVKATGDRQGDPSGEQADPPSSEIMEITFDRLVKLSPYPVRVEPEPFIGIFKRVRYGQPHIIIDDGIISSHEGMAVLLHEIGHAICHKKKCECYKVLAGNSHTYLPEYHAERFAFRFMLQKKMNEVLNWRINFLIDGCGEFEDYHNKAIDRLRTDPIWQKCKDYLANQPARRMITIKA